MITAAIVTMLAAAAGPDLTGSWRLDGKVESFAYTLDCRLTQNGSALSGVCTDVATSDAEHKPQGSHTLTMGKIEGDKVTFAYQTRFLAIPFNVTYSGVLNGETIRGDITVPGRRGRFTAVRR